MTGSRIGHISCSFCLKPDIEVGKSITGPGHDIGDE